MSVDILGTSWDQCRSMVQLYCFTSTETRRLARTDSPGRPPRLSHSSWTTESYGSFMDLYIGPWKFSLSQGWSETSPNCLPVVCRQQPLPLLSFCLPGSVSYIFLPQSCWIKWCMNAQRLTDAVTLGYDGLDPFPLWCEQGVKTYLSNWLTDWLTDSLTHSLTHSFTHSLTDWLKHTI